MLLTATAWACEEAVLARLPAPSTFTAEPVIARGSARSGGVSLAGARISYRSAHPLAKWAEVLDRPQDQDDWHPASLGTRRAELLDPRTLYQQMDLRMVWGAVRIRRQVVALISWTERNDRTIRNCWIAGDPAPWQDHLVKWPDDAPFQRHGMGGWDLHALPGGGTSVSYSIWADTGVMPAAVQSWAMSKTLPELMAAFEAYVGR